MKNSTIALALLFASLFILGGCQSANEAEKTGDQFHAYLKKRDYTSIAGMISEEALQITPESDWINLMKEMEQLGEIQKVKKNMGFKTNISGGKTTVELTYTITLDKGKVQEEIIFMKAGNGPFKLHGYKIQQQ